MTEPRCPSCGLEYEPPPWQMCLDRWHIDRRRTTTQQPVWSKVIATLTERVVDAEARVRELEAAIAKHRAAIEPERCTTCTTDSHQLWNVLHNTD